MTVYLESLVCSFTPFCFCWQPLITSGKFYYSLQTVFFRRAEQKNINVAQWMNVFVNGSSGTLHYWRPSIWKSMYSLYRFVRYTFCNLNWTFGQVKIKVYKLIVRLQLVSNSFYQVLFYRWKLHLRASVSFDVSLAVTTLVSMKASQVGHRSLLNVPSLEESLVKWTG